jgi:hypothetical protein
MFLSRCELGARLPGLQALLPVYHPGSDGVVVPSFRDTPVD